MNPIKTIKPPALLKGDKIGIISPSEPIIYKKKFLAGVATLKKIGFCVVLGKNVFKEYGAYMAGTDKERAADINAMLKNPKIKGIFSSRGGMTSNRLLNLIDFNLIKKNPKIFMGFSDITVLLNAIYKKTGLITFHGPNVEFGFSRGLKGKHNFTLEYFKKALMTPCPIGNVPRRKIIDVLKPGKATGALVGGNLEVLMTLIGTEYEPDWKSKILFWEEGGRTTEEIDFWLTHLKLSKVFEKISGMVIGKLIGITRLRSGDEWDPKKTFPIAKIILDICREYKFPIIKGIPFGHYYPQIIVPIGAKATIDTSKKLFSIDESGVI
jgi:muramoyltetrapeptide carboxypeptidase